MSEFKWYAKYLIAKVWDVEEALTFEEKNKLYELLAKVVNYRLSNYKPIHQYLVINKDEPYFDEVFKIVEENNHDG